MTILNIMLGRYRGGIEQTLIDYAEALKSAGYAPLNIVHPDSWARAQCEEKKLPYATLRNLGGWDLFAAWKLRRIAHKHGAQAAICHGNRSLALSLSTLEGHIPVLAVANNYKTRRFVGADICLAVTRHAAEQLASHGIDKNRIFLVPNAVRTVPLAARTSYRTPPAIGSMGRFVKKKAFDLYIDALAQLQARGLAFAATLGGGGEEEADLKTRAAAVPQLQFIGWVEDKAQFFADTDIFVLPSHHEPFGIVMLEAMAYGVPIISTDSEGPREVISHGIDGLLVPKGDATALADAIAMLLTDESFARKLTRNARTLIERAYSIEAQGARLKEVLEKIL